MLLFDKLKQAKQSLEGATLSKTCTVYPSQGYYVDEAEDYYTGKGISTEEICPVDIDPDDPSICDANYDPPKHEDMESIDPNFGKAINLKEDWIKYLKEHPDTCEIYISDDLPEDTKRVQNILKDWVTLSDPETSIGTTSEKSPVNEEGPSTEEDAEDLHELEKANVTTTTAPVFSNPTCTETPEFTAVTTTEDTPEFKKETITEKSFVDDFLEKYVNGNDVIQVLRYDLMKLLSDVQWIKESGRENEQYSLDFADAINEISGYL